MKDCAIIVPARLGSQRFPRKLLQPVCGKPLILWTAENIGRIAPDLPLYFAVAEEELREVLDKAGYACIMTDPELPSGTDRIGAANRQIGASSVINVQADEPVLAADHIRQLLELLDTGVDMATLATPFTGLADFKDPNKVKVVTALDGRALYFSRSAIPWERDSGGGLPPRAYWHLGLYGYSREVLERFQSWAPTYLEMTEKLEQLRVLENGGRIGVGITQTRTIGIDVPEDLSKLEAALEQA
ncbi:MAG TPA: 3-deoxy-manno-octulosonate cytidylyltransferase [Oceanipulchritudo sp.]|nr:3-deoxy-manno-octulosonate cytidylyltransferase [Oceanipulchritudo sp.]